MRGPYIWIERRAFVEDLSEEGEAGEDIRLVDAGNNSLATIRLAIARQLEREVEQAFADVAGDDHGIACFTIVDDRTLATRREETFGRLPDDDKIQGTGAVVGENRFHAGQGLDRTDSGIETELDPQVDLR